MQRGRILKILYKAFPDGVSDRLISLTLNDLHIPAASGTLKGHCRYLEGKGYVKMEDVQEGDLIDFEVKITPKGIDLLEGNIEADPGVDT